jgi:hypothetical protein
MTKSKLQNLNEQSSLLKHSKVSRNKEIEKRKKPEKCRKMKQKAHLPCHFLWWKAGYEKPPWEEVFTLRYLCLCCKYITSWRWRALVQLSSVPWRLCAVSLQHGVGVVRWFLRHLSCRPPHNPDLTWRWFPTTALSAIVINELLILNYKV